MLRALRLPALITATLLAGCGATDPQSAKAPLVAPPETGGPLTVAPVDGRVGEATSATSTRGTERLSTGKKTPRGVLRQGVGAGAACADTELLPEVDNLPQVSAATMCLVNGERADAGLPPLGDNGKLTQSSLVHSQDMVARSYFAHQSQDGGDVVERVRSTGYIPDDAAWTVGENLAWGTGTLATPQGIVQAWMNSQGHRENILRSAFKEAGLGVAIGNPHSSDGEGATYTMNFGAVESTTVQQVASSPPTPRQSTATRTPAAKRSAARKRRACRARARRMRAAKVRKARIARCRKTARRLRR